MYRKYTSEEFKKLVQSLPKNVKDAFFSEETGNNITKICNRYNLDNFSEILNLVGQVLLGLLPPEELEKVIIRDLEIDVETSKKISKEIVRFIFFPIKEDLLTLYEMKFSSSKVLEDSGGDQGVDIREDGYREPVK